VVLISLVLTFLIDPWWLSLAAFIAFNAVQSAFSDFCLVEYLVLKLRRPSARERTHT
jgi:hypothetical protein